MGRMVLGLVVGLLVFVLATQVGFAGPDREIEAAKKKVQELLRKAEELKKAGRHDEARKLVTQAEELANRLRKAKSGGKRKPVRVEEAKKILHGLEMGMEALEALGRHEDAKRLARIADELRAKLEARHRGDDERGIVKKRIETMRIAMHGLLEAEKKDAAHRLEHAIHALELALEGRRDPEAIKIRETAPDREQQAELLIYASKIWAEFGHEGKAERVEALARELLGKRGERARRDRPQKERPQRDRPGGRSERDIVEHRIEVMRLALPALLEAGKRDAADLLERAIHGYRLKLEGRRDAEARQIYESMPTQDQQAELLMLAGKLWREYGNADKAEWCLKLSRELAGRPGRDRPQRGRPQRGGDDERMADLARKLAEMQKVLDEMRAQLERLQRERR
ncbi:MAG: hypothetical protein ACYTDY_00135 [Planctomycetota bacterium]